MAAALQVRLLLWKDYLIRKRKPITLSGVAWATLVMLCLYAVRINVDNTDYPTCQFAARALPSAGVLNFLQSFICNVNNECSEFDKFEEIPAYEKSSFSKLKRELSPLLGDGDTPVSMNTVLHGARLLSTLANVADNPVLLNFTRDGLHVSDLFSNPKRAKRYLSKQLDLSDDVSNSVLIAEVGLNGIFNGGIDRCKIDSVANIIKINNSEHLKLFVEKLCALSKKEVENLVVDLFLKVDLGKYVKMLGDMYSKLSGDTSFLKLGDMVSAVLRMMAPGSFLPQELTTEDEFSYVNMTMLTKVMDLFEPTFGETESFKSMKEVVDTTVLGSQYLHKFLITDDSSDSTGTAVSSISTMMGFDKLKKIYKRIVDIVSETSSEDVSDSFFNILSRVINFVFKWMPDSEKQEILFYSTLFSKLVEGSQKVININADIESVAYNVSLRNPKGVKLLLSLPPNVVGNGLEALADAERTQILTSKLNDPGQIFCDINGIRSVFLVSNDEADKLKSQLCNDVWKSYINDLVSSFGIYDVKENINSMAGLFVLKTIGKDISDQLYSIDKDVNILKSFIITVRNMDDQEKVHVDWPTTFNISENSELLKVFKSKEHLGKQMLITVHGAFAKEVVRQNPLLEYKISPFLKDMAVMVDAMNRQLDTAPRELQELAKKLYPDIVQTLLSTALEEDKTYLTLSTPCVDILCNGPDNAGLYLNFPFNINKEKLVPVLCNMTLAIEEGLTKDSIIGKVITKIKSSKHSVLDEINWTQLITDLNNLYVKLNNDYTYLFDKTFGMNETLQKKVMKKIEETKEFWFSFRNLNRAMHLSIKLGFRLLDFLDYGSFDISQPIWKELKLRLSSAVGPITVVHDVLKVIGDHSGNDSRPIPGAGSLRALVLGAPQLITDVVDLIIRDNTDIQPIISLLNADIPWPCVSITTALDLPQSSVQTVQAIEKLMCLEPELQEEWRTYLEEKRVYPENWNLTELPKNIFLKFSAAFDLLVKDLDIVNELFNQAFAESDDGSTTFASAVTYSIDAFKNRIKNETLSNFLSKVDTVLNSVNTSSIQDTVSLNILWKDYLNCSHAHRGQIIDDNCKTLGRATWKNTLKFFSVAFQNITEDLSTYLRESREPNATALQKLGFTRKTGLYMLYDKLPDFLAILINSYFDYGFMSKVRRASESQFWDCEEVVGALVPAAPGAPTLTAPARTLLCPSLLHWVSMPRGDNSIIDLFTKPQYLFFSMEVSNLTSEYEKAYMNFNELTTILNNISYTETTLTEDVKIKKLRENLVHAVDMVLSYSIKDTEPSYRRFSKNNKKQYTSMVYLTRVATMINKITTALNTFNMSDVDSKILEAELPIIQKGFKRRPSEVIAFNFDLITDVLWTNDPKYNMVEALTNACNRLNNRDKSKDILVELDRVKAQMCAKQYTLLYGALQKVIQEDFDATRNSLINVVEVMEDGAVEDISVFFNERKELVDSLKTSVKYSYDLGMPIYLKYLQNNLKHYDIILSFLSGDNWWGELRKLYNGPQARGFFDTIEQVFDIAEDILTHLDKIHLVKLLRDVNVNSTAALCRVSLSDYVPDGSGALSSLLKRACFGNRTLLLRELPTLLFASQGLDDDLKISTEVDYGTLYSDMSNTESKIEQIKDGPKSPSRPLWITEEKLNRFRTVAKNLLSKESLIEISFGLLSNVVDAGTLFLNNSQCTVCSPLTSWLKQLDLQLYKRQEYDSLLCALDTMKLDEIHAALKNNFHWDMAITELISTRNYTKYELNKSMNELLEQVKLHLLEDVSTNGTKLFQCLANNVTRNMFGNAALFAKVLSRTAKLIRAILPHLQEIPGITELSYFKQLYIHVAHKLHANDTLAKYINDKTFSHKIMEVVKNKKLVQAIENANIDLHVIKEGKLSKDSVFINHIPWDDICRNYDCDKIMSTISTYINRTLVHENLVTKQKSEFWKFTFISSIVQHMEDFVEHLAGVVGGVSEIDVVGMREGKMVSILDAMLTMLRDDFMDPLEHSVLGVLQQLEPLHHGTALEFDITAVTEGLKILRHFKTFLIQQSYKLRVSAFFPESYRIESSFNELGINNTNFWSMAASRIRAGQIAIESVLAHRGSIRDFLCDIDTMSQALIPGDLEPVSRDDVLGAVVEQFCETDDDLARNILLVLIENVNFPEIINFIKAEIISQLFKASNLTQSEGNDVLSKLNDIGTYLPQMRESFEKIGNTLANEPLVARLKNGSVGEVLGSPDFFSEAGNMMCGTPMYTQLGRLYRSVARAPDQKAEPDQEQLNALPTDYCRSLYKDIVRMEGGKILWSFVKPLVMGKILYTPSSPTVTRIIEKANATFSPMIRLMNMVHEFSSSFPHIQNLTHHRDGLKALQNLVTMPRFRELRESLIGNVSAPDVDVDQIFDQLGDVESLGSLLSRSSSLLRCVSAQRFAPAASEHDLALEAARLTMINEFSAGLVFMDVTESNHFPSNISYKIRMDIENAPTTKRIKNYFWTPGPEGSFLENMRYFRGFVQIQDIIDKAIIELSMENAGIIKKREIKGKSDWAIYTQQLPYPCYRRDFFQTSLYESQSLIVAFFFSLLFSVCSAVRFIVKDKETGNTMLMSVMGVDLRCHTLSWFVSSFLELVLTMCCVCGVLCGGHILPRSDPSLVLSLLLVYSFSVLTFCYMMSKMFSVAGSAAVVSGLAYLLSFMPFVLILSLEAVMTSSLKIFVSLSMSSSLCYGFLFITRLEAMGMGAGWAQLWETPEGSTDMSIGISGLMVLADGILYLIVGLVLDRFFGIKTTNNITVLQASDEKAGVSIVNVSKEYTAGSRALDGVCMELHRGQITTLLGHNGAGKTTLIKILTGMLKPTKGHVIVRTEEEAEVARLGVCPQHDVLFEQLSAREHVQMYAQLKSGRAFTDVKDEVDSMLSVLSLGAVCERPVSQLSGGTRRRLCVALAFVGRPALVSLDEPTAGVDPAARRDIWSMIMKLRENRTILMTTHHLDEAELLSDQIIIMHKGQIHTTGSPIEIKRTLGTGYKLTVTYPETEMSEDISEELGIEQKTKDLLAVVRNVIKNANLVDVTGSEVEINLPFYDANGVSNDIQGACEALENAQGSGRRQVALDCSSLEQVFHDLCRRADAEPQTLECDVLSLPESSTSVSGSSKEDLTPLVDLDGPLKGTLSQQFWALMYARYLHYIRNKWLVLILIVLPSLFLATAMAFSSIRPPADIEVSLALEPQLYEPSTSFIIKQPSIYSKNIDPSFSRNVLDMLQYERKSRNWTSEDSPSCKCIDALQHCDIQTDRQWDLPEMMVLSDVTTLNNWLVDSQQIYIEKRYGGFTATLRNNLTHLIAWYNNKGHHALPVYINALNSAILKTVTGDPTAHITVYTHPLKISTEQLNKDNVYQHVADAGISGMLLIAYSLAGAGGAALAVASRVGRQKRLQLLCGTPPALLAGLQLLWDMMVIGINMVITAIILEIFNFPVFVAKNNLPAICILILLFGYSCSGLVSVFEKLFRDPSLATMLLFCGNAFAGLVGIALLLILDVISDSDATDHARYVLHKLLLLSPQFALGDGLLEIAKNTIQAQVLSQFGMDTYRDPLRSNVVFLHYGYMLAVGTALHITNLLIEYHCFEALLETIRRDPDETENESKDGWVGGCSAETGVAEEAARVMRALAPVTLRTVGNINAGFVDTEGMAKPRASESADVVATLRMRHRYGSNVALRGLTLGLPPGQCTVLLGENGAGKSTAFAILTGELRPTSGELYLQGQRVSRRDLYRGLISYCPQSDAVDPLLTVNETLEIYCRLRGIENPKKVAERAMAAFELRAHGTKTAGALSGGMRRKLCTALAAAARAPLLLLDEPTSGMDPQSRACVWRAVRGVCEADRVVCGADRGVCEADRAVCGADRAVCEAGRAVLLSTHALDDARRLARRVALLRAGELCAVAPLQHCLQRFGGGYVVSCRVRGSATGAWRRVQASAPRAVLRLLLPTALHFLMPLHATVDGKESLLKLSDIFRLMSELQKSCDIDDYTVNQSSLDQMFLSFTDKTSIVDLEDESRMRRRRNSEEQDSVTAL